MLKSYIAEYWESGVNQGYQEVVCSVVANTESEALGLVLAEYPNLNSTCWAVKEVDLSAIKVEQLSEEWEL